MMFAKDLPRFKKTPLRRDVIHIRCGTTLTIEYPLLAEICDPFSNNLQILCPRCICAAEAFEFAWADTNEHLSEFRVRLRNAVPIVIRYIDSETTKWGCIAIAATSGLSAIFIDSFWLVVPLILVMIYYLFGIIFAGIWGMVANFGDAI